VPVDQVELASSSFPILAKFSPEKKKKLKNSQIRDTSFFHSRTVQQHLDIIRAFIYQLMHNRVPLKILQFTLKQLRHVSV
jgi:hypothetical protein